MTTGYTCKHCGKEREWWETPICKSCGEDDGI